MSLMKTVGAYSDVDFGGEVRFWVTGGKAPSEDMYSALRQVADIARSAFHY
jgi:hypothetical protein